MRLMGMNPDRKEASAAATDLTAWAEETLPMLRAALPRHVRLECRISQGLGVTIARHRLAQAVFNLVQNAGEAMAAQSDGAVHVTADAALDNGSALMVLMRVRDNGPGMTPAVLSHCFEPYFSTKGRAIATGMGLGMVKGIVEDAGGTITAESTPGRGTVFTLALPATIAASGVKGGGKTRPMGAVSVANRRIADLACMFLENLQFECVRHQGSDSPSALLWVLDHADPKPIAEYLRHDPRRRAVVLVGAGVEGSRASTGASSEFPDRTIALPELPTPGALRDALVAARHAAENQGK
jgi:hypothetical protein